MIRSALDRDADSEEIDSHVEAIAFHCNIQPEDIRIMNVDDGGDMKVLRHFVAIDRENSSVVLALRGTLSISGALVDMKGMDREFFIYHRLVVVFCLRQTVSPIIALRRRRFLRVQSPQRNGRSC